MFRPSAEFVPGYEASIFVGVTAPRARRAEIVRSLNEAITLGLADPRLKQRIAELGDTPLPLSPQAFGKLIAEETEKWRERGQSRGHPRGVMRTFGVRRQASAQLMEDGTCKR